ncbi:MAG: sulfatase [Deltaproteobacteria bacterium]|nr:sulfatase [Deltaproteobacteria bacterium]
MRIRPRAFVLAMGALLVAAACGKPPENLPNVVLISVDTLRADRVGSYGYEKKPTPVTDLLAERGVRFANARTAAPWTLPSHATMFTGLYPTDHRAIDDKVKIRDDAPMLGEIMKKRGYRTAAFVTHYYVGADYGFDRGFDKFVLREEAGGDQVADLANAWVKDHQKESFFLFLHFFDPHTPYAPPPTLRAKYLPAASGFVRGDTADVLSVVHGEGRPDYEPLLSGLSALYDGEIEHTDAMIGRVLGFMKRLEIANTIVVFVSDHGEEFMEHRLMEHGFTLYEEQLHVPFVVYWPERFPEPKVISDPVTLADLAPTLADLVGAPVPEGITGKSLVPLMDGGTIAPRRFFAETTRQGPDRVALIDGRWKFIYTPPFRLSGRLFGMELYDLDADPREKNNLVETDRDRAKAYLLELEASGRYAKRRLFSLLFAGTQSPVNYLGTVLTGGSFISAFKDDVIYDTDKDRKLVSREFGMKKEARKLDFLALGSDGSNGVHFIIEPETAKIQFDLLVDGERDAAKVTVGDAGRHPDSVPFDLAADAAGARRFSEEPGYTIACREILANANVVTRAEVGDQIEMSPEMVERLRSLGYIDDGGAIKAAPPGKDAAPGLDGDVAYTCAPLAE